MATFSLGVQAQTTIEEIAADIRSVWLHFRLNQTNLHYINLHEATEHSVASFCFLVYSLFCFSAHSLLLPFQMLVQDYAICGILGTERVALILHA